jgi:hypothetical protein
MTVLVAKPYLSGISAIVPKTRLPCVAAPLGLPDDMGMSKTPANRPMKPEPRPRRPKRRQERHWVKLAPAYMKGLGALLAGAGAFLHGLMPYLLR